MQVSTIFWWDNFDRNAETSTGGGSIHNTPAIVFQEQSSNTVWKKHEINIPKSNKQSLELEQHDVIELCIVPKTDPPLFIRVKPPETSNSKQKMSMDLPYLWKTLRLVNPAQQVHPRFASWIISTLKIPHSVHTVLTYLPPIQIPITDF